MQHSAESIFAVEYLGEYESIFKTVLAHASVEPGAFFGEKTRGRKSCETVPLRGNLARFVISSFSTNPVKNTYGRKYIS
jgi:hypothetical protein